jgi:short-subunit dehydrogenase
MKELILITGASGGLGKAFAFECAGRGWNLFLTDLDQKSLETLANGLIDSYGINVITYPCDLTCPAAREDLFKYISKKEFGFQGLINVAGCDFEGLYLNQTPAQIRTLSRLNMESILDLTHFLLKNKLRSDRFIIITVSSLAAFFPIPYKAIYSSSKKFLLNFSLALREELRNSGTTITVLCPAGLPTRPDIIRSIELQGFMGHITSKNIGEVAYRTMEYALKGKAIYIPGFLNRLLAFFGSKLPPIFVAYFLGRKWKSVHKKMKANQ